MKLAYFVDPARPCVDDKGASIKGSRLGMNFGRLPRINDSLIANKQFLVCFLGSKSPPDSYRSSRWKSIHTPRSLPRMALSIYFLTPP